MRRIFSCSKPNYIMALLQTFKLNLRPGERFSYVRRYVWIIYACGEVDMLLGKASWPWWSQANKHEVHFLMRKLNTIMVMAWWTLDMYSWIFEYKKFFSSFLPNILLCAKWGKWISKYEYLIRVSIFMCLLTDEHYLP